jgi:hypothetical protein
LRIPQRDEDCLKLAGRQRRVLKIDNEEVETNLAHYLSNEWIWQADTAANCGFTLLEDGFDSVFAHAVFLGPCFSELQWLNWSQDNISLP